MQLRMNLLPAMRSGESADIPPRKKQNVLAQNDDMPAKLEIFIATSDAEIESCFPVFKALRPHLQESAFLDQVRRQQLQSYQILALKDGSFIKSVAGFRLAEFLAWGKVVYLDDLATLPGEDRRGYAGALLDRLIEYAKSLNCRGVHLDSGYARFAAHRLYLQKGFQLNCHHLILEFS